jgi:hypothetical protein
VYHDVEPETIVMENKDENWEKNEKKNLKHKIENRNESSSIFLQIQNILRTYILIYFMFHNQMKQTNRDSFNIMIAPMTKFVLDINRLTIIRDILIHQPIGKLRISRTQEGFEQTES